MTRSFTRASTIYILVLPALFMMLGLVIYPIGVSFYYSLTNWDGLSDYRFIGFESYQEILVHDEVFWNALRNSLLLALGFIVVQHPFAILMGILTQYAGRWEKALRIVLFVPAIISTFVTSQLWTSILSTQFGMLNRLLDGLHLSAWKQDWLGDASFAIASVIVVVMWQGFGYAYLLYYTGIKAIPTDLHEVAIIEGATEFQYNTRIVLPILNPVIRVNVILAIVAGFKQMETVFLMTAGGPADSTQFMSTYLYSKAFREGLYGYGSAISVLFVGLCVLVTWVLNRLLKRDVGEF